MKIKRIILVAFWVTAAGFLSPASAQSSHLTNQEKIKEVYGNFVQQMSPEQLHWVESCLNRCQIIKQTDIEPEAVIQNLDDVPVLDKYDPALTKIDYATVSSDFIHSNFNPLRYAFDFFQNKNQYFRIGKGDNILKISKR